MDAIITPHDLFIDQLRDLCSMETQLTAALPELVLLSGHPALRELLIRHAEETDFQLSAIREILARHGNEAGEDTCKAMRGLIEGGEAHLKKVEHEPTRDLMMIAHCLRVEHYEIAAYQITQRLAQHLGLDSDVRILETLLDQETYTAAQLLALEPMIFTTEEA